MFCAVQKYHVKALPVKESPFPDSRESLSAKHFEPDYVKFSSSKNFTKLIQTFSYQSTVVCKSVRRIIAKLVEKKNIENSKVHNVFRGKAILYLSSFFSCVVGQTVQCHHTEWQKAPGVTDCPEEFCFLTQTCEEAFVSPLRPEFSLPL